jgi:lysozyme
MTASQACLELIRRYEGLRLESYRCPAGVWTVGYGHTHGVTEGMTITKQMADALLLEDVRAVEADLSPMLAGVAPTQGQWDALVSLCFNIKGGPRRLPIIAPRLWKALHAGDKQKAVVELVDINRAGGKVLAGLTARRKAEAALYLSS